MNINALINSNNWEELFYHIKKKDIDPSIEISDDNKLIHIIASNNIHYILLYIAKNENLFHSFQ